jgi:hypothetical protein
MNNPAQINKWKSKSNFGSPLDNLQIIFFKCPMDYSFDNKISKEKRLYVKDIVEHY